MPSSDDEVPEAPQWVFVDLADADGQIHAVHCQVENHPNGFDVRAAVPPENWPGLRLVRGSGPQLGRAGLASAEALVGSAAPEESARHGGPVTPEHASPRAKGRRAVPANLPPDESRLPLLLTVEEAAAILRKSVTAVYADLERNLVPGVVRLGRGIRLDRDAFLRGIRRGRGRT